MNNDNKQLKEIQAQRQAKLEDIVKEQEEREKRARKFDNKLFYTVLVAIIAIIIAFFIYVLYANFGCNDFCGETTEPLNGTMGR